MNQSEVDEAEPDLTPMLDVVFIMLIFFIVTATFVKEIGLDLPGDDSKPSTVKASESLIIRITKADRFFVNGKHTDRRALLVYLSALHAEKPSATMVVIPNAASTADSLVFALDVGRILGVKTSISPEVGKAWGEPSE
jgi:biopolymer transport protein ExbD